MKFLAIFSFLLLSLDCFSQQNLVKQVIENENLEWKKYCVYSEVEIDFRFETCSNNQNEKWVVFRFTNLSKKAKSIHWNPIWSRDFDCVNCSNVSGREFDFTLMLDPNEVVSGESCASDSRLFMFSSFIKKYPGMDNKKMTEFQFTNVSVDNL